MYNVQFMLYIMYKFSQNVQECTILLNFQIHCVQNVHSSHPELLLQSWRKFELIHLGTLRPLGFKKYLCIPFYCIAPKLRTKDLYIKCYI